MHISTVLDYALELCDSKKNGGRTAVLNNSQGQILDCSYWPEEYSQALIAKFPQCKITFISSPDVSLTGFYIFLSLEDRLPRLKNSDLALLGYILIFLGFRVWDYLK